MKEEKKFYLATNIAYLRKKKKKSQIDMAIDFGYSNTTISNWENGIRIPESLDLPRLKKYFNVAIDDLFEKDLRLEDQNYKIIEEKDFVEQIADILGNSSLSEKKQNKILSDIEFYRNEE